MFDNLSIFFKVSIHTPDMELNVVVYKMYKARAGNISYILLSLHINSIMQSVQLFQLGLLDNSRLFIPRFLDAGKNPGLSWER